MAYSSRQKVLAKLYILVSSCEGDFVSKSYVLDKIVDCLRGVSHQHPLSTSNQKKCEEFLKNIFPND